MKNQNPSTSSSSRLFVLATLALALGALYIAKEILLPLALAVLLCFVLTPVVVWLERRRLGRITSVLLVTLITFTSISGVAWVAASQVVELSVQLPEYKDNLISKIRSVRKSTTGKLSKAKEAIEDIGEELTDGDDEQTNEPTDQSLGGALMAWLQSDPTHQKEKRDAVAVNVVRLPPSPFEQVKSWLGPFVGPLSTSGLVAVLVVFMLMKREDLRNRFVQLLGTARLYATTEALDDATSRLSRYLRMQLLINAIYGILVASSLYLIGVPNALLWGVFGMLLRFLPYVGPWIAATMPIVLSMAVFDGWMAPALTMGVFILLEIIVNNVLEPWLYGTSTGVSSFGVVLAAIFWAWLWGPIGLVLAMPMTVCVVVLGKYVPQLEFLTIILGDRSSLAPHEKLYQRLLTPGDHEAQVMIDEYLESGGLIDMYDEMVIPALHLAERDRHAGLLNEQQEAEVIESARELVDELRDHPQLALRTSDGQKAERGRVLCVPVRDQADESAALIMEQLLSSDGFEVEVASLHQLASEIAARLEGSNINTVVLSALPPLGSRNSRYLCKRLRQHYPQLNIVVAMFGGEQRPKTRQRLLDSGASLVVTRLPEALTALRKCATLGPSVKSNDVTEGSREDEHQQHASDTPRRFRANQRRSLS